MQINECFSGFIKVLMRKRGLKIADLMRKIGGSQSYVSNFLNQNSVHGKKRGVSMAKADELLCALDSDFGQFQEFINGGHLYHWDFEKHCWIKKQSACNCCGVSLKQYVTSEMIEQFGIDGFVGDMTRECASDMSELLDVLKIDHTAEVDTNPKNNNFCDNSGHVCLKKVV